MKCRRCKKLHNKNSLCWLHDDHFELYLELKEGEIEKKCAQTCILFLNACDRRESGEEEVS